MGRYYRICTQGHVYWIERRCLGVWWSSWAWYGITDGKYDSLENAEAALRDWITQSQYRELLHSRVVKTIDTRSPYSCWHGLGLE